MVTIFVCVFFFISQDLYINKQLKIQKIVFTFMSYQNPCFESSFSGFFFFFFFQPYFGLDDEIWRTLALCTSFASLTLAKGLLHHQLYDHINPVNFLLPMKCCPSHITHVQKQG
jgi:hypothetical protein